MLHEGFSAPLMFSLFKMMGLGPKTKVNAWSANTRAKTLRKNFKAGKFASVESALDNALIHNPDLYHLYISALKQFSGKPRKIRTYLKKYPESSHAYLIAGAQQIHWAWVARTGLHAEHVTDKQWEAFFSRLNEAYDFLEQAQDLNHSNSEVYSRMIIAGMGLQLDADELFRTFTMLKIRNPDHVIGHMHLLYTLTKKWGGSDEAMFGFARKTLEQSAPGSALGVLIAQAHIEKWTSCYYGEDLDVATEYISADPVRQELHQAYQHSIGNPAYQSGVLDPTYFGVFAMAFYLSGDIAPAKRCIAKLVKGADAYPWYYLYEIDNADLNTGYVIDKVIKDLRRQS